VDWKITLFTPAHQISVPVPSDG